MQITSIMPITRWLKLDHAKFRRTLGKISSCLHEPAPKGPSAAKHELLKLINTLKIHEDIEEKHVLPAMMTHSKNIDVQILRDIIDAHASMQNRFQVLWESLDKDFPPLNQILADIEFEKIFLEHMDSEEKIFFPAIEKILPIDLQEELTWLAKDLSE